MRRFTPSWPRRPSLGIKVLVALGVTLAVATGLSLLVGRQITSSRLAEQAERLLHGNLSIAVQADTDARATRLTSLRFSAQRLQTEGIGQTTRIPVLQQRAAEVQRVLGVDGVVFARTDGSVLARAGDTPLDHDLGPLTTTTSVAPLVRTGPRGSVLELTPARVDERLWVASAEALDDSRAFELRRLIGRDIALVVDGAVVGSTILDRDAIAEAAEAVDLTSPSVARTRSVRVDAVHGRALVGFAPLIRGVMVAVISDPLLVGLEQSLASAQLLTFLALLLTALALGYVWVQRLTRPLSELADTAEAVGRGAQDRRFPTDSKGEIGQLGATLERMRATLQEQVGIISEQSDALRESSQRIAATRDRERRRLAQDLHDGVQQQLIMLRLRLSMLEDTPHEELQELSGAVDDIIQRIRETSQWIYPSILSDRGLTGGLRSIASTAAVPVDLHMDPDPLPRMPEAIEAGLYFIVAEALTNVAKHAQAGRACVNVRTLHDGDLIEVTVCDDGGGFDDSGEAVDDSSGAGVQNIKDRVAALAGVAMLASRIDVGTVLVVQVPTTRPEGGDRRTREIDLSPVVADVFADMRRGLRSTVEIEGGA